MRTPDGGGRPDGYPPSRGYPPGGSLPGGYPPSGHPPGDHYAPRPAGPANGRGPAGYHGPPAPPQSMSHPAPWAPAPPAPAPLPVPEPGTFVYRDSGDSDEPEYAEAAEYAEYAEAAELDGVYGPDDPAYGPPDPSWYDRQQEEDEAALRQAEELQHARGAFEPLRHTGDAGQDYHAEAGYQALADEAPASLATAGEDDRGTAVLSQEALSEEALGEEAPSEEALSQEALSEAVLAQLKDLYMTAEAIGEENLGKHYEQLLGRQRQLISEYFKEPGPGDSGASQVSVSGESPQ